MSLLIYNSLECFSIKIIQQIYNPNPIKPVSKRRKRKSLWVNSPLMTRPPSFRNWESESPEPKKIVKIDAFFNFSIFVFHRPIFPISVFGSVILTWPIIGISAMATQLSAISFISAPGFVGLKGDGGGTLWLCAEFAVPLAMLILIMVVYPVFYQAKIVTIYEYLNSRFDSSTRLAISLVFQISRILATGISIYVTAIVFQAAFNINYLLTILIVSVVTIIYAATGGIKAVIYADVIQMIIIFIGIFFCAFYALHLMGGWDVFIAHLDKARLNAVDFSEWGYKGKHEYGFWPMVFGGLSLYLFFKILS